MSAVFSLSSADTARLAAADLPPRVRELLGALIGLCRHALTAPLILTVEALEQTLLHDADHARNPQQQAELLAQRGQLHAFAGHFSDRMLDALADALARLREPIAPVVAAATPPPLPGMLRLSLVAEHEVDRDLLLTEMVRRETLRSANALNLLGQRLGVVAGAPAFEADTLPLAPQALCTMVRKLAEQDALSAEVQMALYRSFERQVLERLGDVLDRANALLAQHGILPGLVYTPYLARSSSTRRIITQSVGSGRSGRPSPRVPTPMTGWGGSAPPGSWSTLMQDAFADADAPGASAGMTVPASSVLHEMLQQARQTPQPATNPAALPSAAVDAVLARLQGQASAASAMTDLQAAVVAQLRSEHGAQASLGSHDRDNLDLLRLLLQKVQQQQRPDPVPAALLARLQVPLARAAMADPGFFVRDEHPARELLNHVAEAGASWLGDDDVDPQLLQRLAQSVQGLLGKDARTPEAFAAANEEIQQHQRAAAHRAELAERRHVEAARGKERLELARRQATAQIDQCCDTQEPPRFVQTLLRQAWADALTLTRLRHGDDSPQWQERLQQTERIATITAERQRKQRDRRCAGCRVESALLQVGYHAEEAAAVARRLSTPGGEDESTSRTELSARLKARARLGEHTGAQALASDAAPRSEAEEASYQQLCALPFGSWFDIDDGDGEGALRRQRLSWYSLLTGHVLLVNARGQKIGETSLDALARQMAAGRAQLVTEDKGRLVDRAWQASLSALRTLAGRRPQEPNA
ncbi:thymidine phosphorylase [bacterium AM6]|nr:thymidine phosphorylase [bacterium AM6]